MNIGNLFFENVPAFVLAIAQSIFPNPDVKSFQDGIYVCSIEENKPFLEEFHNKLIAETWTAKWNHCAAEHKLQNARKTCVDSSPKISVTSPVLYNFQGTQTTNREAISVSQAWCVKIAPYSQRQISSNPSTFEKRRELLAPFTN